MKAGKQICTTLKAIRKQIADANGIEYEPKECGFKGDCTGTCPACEQEVKYIEKQLNVRRMLGKAVTIIGVSTGIAALSSCSQKSTQNPDAFSGIIDMNSYERYIKLQQDQDNDGTVLKGKVSRDVDSTACGKFAPPTSDEEKKYKEK